MNIVTRLLCVFAIVAFATSAIAHSAGAAVMASAMITAEAGMSGMDDCDACDDPETSIVCDFVCNAPGMAAIAVPPEGPIPTVTSDVHVSVPERSLRGFAGPPSTQPPRSYL